MRKTLISLLAVGCAALVGAAELQRITYTEPEDFRGPKLEKQEDGSLLLRKGATRSIKSIAVNPAKRCRLSLEYKLVEGCEPISLVVAVNTLVKGRPIGGMTVSTVDGTLTELAEPVVKGATSFKVKDASKWVKPSAKGRRNLCAVFNAKEDLSDLPNFSGSGLIESVSPDGVVTLRKGVSLTRDYPAGTKVRQHYDDESFGIGTLYLRAAPTWKTAAIIVNPPAPGEFIYTKNIWWPKVNAAGVTFQLRGKIPADGGVFFRNIVLEELAD